MVIAISSNVAGIKLKRSAGRPFLFKESKSNPKPALVNIMIKATLRMLDEISINYVSSRFKKFGPIKMPAISIPINGGRFNFLKIKDPTKPKRII